MLERYPQPEDWDRVRFSHEVHWSIGSQGKAKIIRCPGERYCSDCIQEQLNRTDEKKNERLHSWAVIGYSFKLELYFYRVPSNGYGKMNMQVYRDEILRGIVKP